MSDTLDTPKWSAEQVLALAPDASAQRAARGLAGDKPWLETGVGAADDQPPTVWGLCQGSGSVPYQIAVDLTEPAFSCTCPSRKFPCKHALALLLRWSAGSVPDGAAPGWVAEWHLSRAERAARAAARGAPEHDPRDGTERNGSPDERASRSSAVARVPNEKVQARRHDRISGGLEELDRWLADQARAGLASVAKSGYAHWDTMIARLVDAQAGGVAGILRRTAPVAGNPERLLGELAQLRLLVGGYRRLDELPDSLAATVRMRVGLTTAVETVLAGPRTRDRWQVLGIRDEIEDGLTVRRVWLRGAASGQPVLVLSFAVAGQVPTTELLLGTEVNADLCFYPGGRPARGVIAERHGPAAPIPHLGKSGGIADNLRNHAEALIDDPWLERWPMIFDGVVPARVGPGWQVVDGDGDGLPIDPAAGEPWRLVAVAAGRPVAVVGEWTAGGLRPLSAWSGGRLVRL